MSKLTEWTNKTKKLNEGKNIQPGMKVVDCFGHEGFVVTVCVPSDVSSENHGLVQVWQLNRTDYGDDNCEHYSFYGWESMLRILEE